MSSTGDEHVALPRLGPHDIMTETAFLSDALLKIVVVIGIVAPFAAGFAGLELTRRSDTRGAEQARRAAVEIAGAKAMGKSADARAEEARLATVDARRRIADADRRLAEAEGRVAEANLETARLSAEAKASELKLAETRTRIERRTITGDDIAALRRIAPECGRGVNVQVWDEHDLESTGFGFSLALALRYAGIKVNESKLAPTIQNGLGADIVFYSPAYAGVGLLEGAPQSRIWKFFQERGFSVSAVSNAMDQTRFERITAETNEMLTPDYCIMVVTPRPPTSFGTSIFPKVHGPPPRDMDLDLDHLE